jgi:penicillin amidase
MLALLASWDGAMLRSRPEPLVYNAIYDVLARLLLRDELGSLASVYGKPSPLVVRRILEERTSWCDDVRTTREEDCASILRDAVDEAGALLARRHGSRPGEWRWGEAHRAPLENAVLSRVPLVSSLLDLETPLDGGDHTVARAASPSWPELDFAAEHGAGFRAVYDAADFDASEFVIATGQSGNPLSPHYRDLVDDWREGRHVILPCPADEPASARRLLLVPAGSGNS